MRNGLTTSTGAHIVIEDSPELPNILSDGVSVGAGMETMISMKRMEIKRLKAPYPSKCADKIIDPNITSMYSSVHKYSAKSCNAFCYISNTLKNCGCFSPEEVGGIMLPKYKELRKNMTRCSNTVQKKCLTEFNRNIDNVFQTCNCNPECNDTIYKVIC